MTLREMLGLVRGPVKLHVHVTNGTSEISYVNSSPDAAVMLSALEVLSPANLDAPVSFVDSENSKLTSTQGPAFTAIHITRRTTP